MFLSIFLLAVIVSISPLIILTIAIDLIYAAIDESNID